MKRRQFITFIAWPNAGWPQDLRVQHRGWVRLIVALSGMAYMVSSHSARSQELASQGKEAASEQQVFNNACRTCHTIKEGDNRQGPNLHRIIGRKAGSLPDYTYSSAIKGADFVWDEEKLEHFIASPDEVVPGNSMKPYSGLASADDRTKVIASCDRSRPVDRDSAVRATRFAGAPCRVRRSSCSNSIQRQNGLYLSRLSPASATAQAYEPRYIRLDPNDNVAIVVNDLGLRLRKTRSRAAVA